MRFSPQRVGGEDDDDDDDGVSHRESLVAEEPMFDAARKAVCKPLLWVGGREGQIRTESGILYLTSSTSHIHPSKNERHTKKCKFGKDTSNLKEGY